MGYYSAENITIRRKDRKPVTQEDLTSFEQFFHDDFAEDFWSEVFCDPHICHNGMEIFAGCTIKWNINGDEMTPFAKANPHLQIEIRESSDSDDVGRTRYLYEGDLYEELHEIRHYEEPKMIDWKEGA